MILHFATEARVCTHRPLWRLQADCCLRLELLLLRRIVGHLRHRLGALHRLLFTAKAAHTTILIGTSAGWKRFSFYNTNHVKVIQE